jgi:hypothetical protein
MQLQSLEVLADFLVGHFAKFRLSGYLKRLSLKECKLYPFKVAVTPLCNR